MTPPNTNPNTTTTPTSTKKQDKKKQEQKGKVPYRQIRALYTTSSTPKNENDNDNDDTIITVYQAYNTAIANAAVAHQRLDASPKFRTTRMTWIKPSWAWMLYRAGYSYKDAGQARILALRMRRGDFLGLLERGCVSTTSSPSEDSGCVSGDGGGGGDNSGAGDDDDDDVGVRESGKDETRGDGRDGDREEEDDDDDAKKTPRRKGAKQRRLPEVRIQWDPERTVRLGKLEYRSIQIGIPASLSQAWVENMIVGIEDVTDKARELKRVLDERPDVSQEELIELGLVPVERPFEVPEELQRGLRMI